MRNLTIVFLLVVCSLSAQTNVVKEGYFIMYDESGIQMAQKNSEREVIQDIYNYYINTGKTATYTSPKIRVDFGDWLVGDIDRDTIYVDVPTVHYDTVFIDNEQTKIVNTIVINGVEYAERDIEQMLVRYDTVVFNDTECFEDYNKKVWLWNSPETVWIPFKGAGMINLQVDSMPDWKKLLQNDYKIEMIADRVEATRTYKELDMPFQFMVSDSVVSIEPELARLRVFASEDWGGKVFVDGVMVYDFMDSSPGVQDFYGYETRRHTISVPLSGLKSQYNVEVKGYSRVQINQEDSAIFLLNTSE